MHDINPEDIAREIVYESARELAATVTTERRAGSVYAATRMSRRTLRLAERVLGAREARDTWATTFNVTRKKLSP